MVGGIKNCLVTRARPWYNITSMASPQFLLALQRVLQFVQSLLQLSLDFVEMVNLVFGSLELLSSLLGDL